MTYYRRNLPHWHPECRSVFVTWRLYGSLPAITVGQLKRKRTSGGGRRFAQFDHALDGAACGPTWLRQPELAGIVEKSIHRGEQLGHYRLHAYVVMPNHVHILIDPQISVARCLRGIKNPTAREANRLLQRTGRPFWQDESFDHWIRSGAEFDKVVWYIENNPVKAGLVPAPEDWRWSSAFARDSQ